MSKEMGNGLAGKGVPALQHAQRLRRGKGRSGRGAHLTA